MARRIVLLDQANGETFSSNSCISFIGRKAWACCKSANIRKVLLEIILGLAFHLGSPRCFIQSIVQLFKIRNSTNVVNDKGMEFFAKQFPFADHEQKPARGLAITARFSAASIARHGITCGIVACIS